MKGFCSTAAVGGASTVAGDETGVKTLCMITFSLHANIPTHNARLSCYSGVAIAAVKFKINRTALLKASALSKYNMTVSKIPL
jgi:hypothetical protein